MASPSREDTEREIHRLIDRKRRVDQQIADVEARIYEMETEYLAETRPYGNIFRGLSGYLTASAGRSVAGPSADKVTPQPALDRPFSSSGCTPNSQAESPKRISRPGRK